VLFYDKRACIVARKKSTSSSRRRSIAGPQLYTIQVFLVGGPVPDAFGGQVISRKIQLRGDQTLHDLHLAIFKAYDRWEHHLYEFNVGTSPRDRSRLYIYSGGAGPIEESCGDPEAITLDALDFQEGQHFGYIFDMGDYWPHELEVSAIEPGPLQGDYPIIVEKVGPSPPQYADDEADEEDWEDE
jgi:hypothetical protein